MAKSRQTIALNEVNLTVSKGDFLVIIGRSGAGKTTLLNLLGGLDMPTFGTVLFEGSPLGKMSNRELAFLRMEKVGFIFQAFNLVDVYTAFENVEAALIPTSLSKTARREMARKALEAFDLADRESHLPLELSLGEQQKVAVARALVKKPLLILADEPTGGVDPISAKEIEEKLIELNRQNNITVVVASHGVFPIKPATQVLYIKDGKFTSQQEAGY